MRISDWSSDVCSSDLDGFHTRSHAFEDLADKRAVGRVDLHVEQRSPRLRLRHYTQGVCGRLWIGKQFGRRVEGRARLGAARVAADAAPRLEAPRSEEHTSELQSLMRISSAVLCFQKKKIQQSV